MNVFHKWLVAVTLAMFGFGAIAADVPAPVKPATVKVVAKKAKAAKKVKKAKKPAKAAAKK